MQRRRWFTWGLGIMAGTVALAAGIGTAAAWGRHGHHGFFKERMFERLDDVLDEAKVSDAQRQSIHAVRDKLFAELHENGPRGRGALFKQAVDLLDQDKLDTQALEKLRAEQVQRMEQKSRAFTEALAEIHEILTPEQRKVVVQQLKEKRHGRWGCQHE